AERPKAHDWKSCWVNSPHGFESRILRSSDEAGHPRVARLRRLIGRFPIRRERRSAPAIETPAAATTRTRRRRIGCVSAHPEDEPIRTSRGQPATAARSSAASVRSRSPCACGVSVTVPRKPLSRRLLLTTNTELNAIAAPASIGLSKDRKSTRLNSSHVKISYAVFCLKKK